MRARLKQLKLATREFNNPECNTSTISVLTNAESAIGEIASAIVGRSEINP